LAEYKNQHFVPKVHFKPFSVEGGGHALNMYLIAQDRPVFGAPVRGQCAKPYFYGKDGGLERLLGRIEGRYGELVSRLADDRSSLDESDRWLLRYFTLLQSHRTAEQIERGFARMLEMASFFRKSEELHGHEWDSCHDPTRERVMAELMLAFSEQMQERVLDDLKVAIIRNRTARDFVTSDDPAVTSNRWLLQKRSIKTFGSNSAGLLLFMPLGPRLLTLMYDPAVYSVSANSPGLVDLKRDADVQAFNMHQYMRAVSAIYFRREEEASLVAAEFKAARQYRPELWDRFTVAKKADESDTHTRYHVGTPDEIAGEDAIMFHLAREWPTPPRWPSILKYRHGAHGFTKGRVIVRRARVEDFASDEPVVYRRIG
jgi:hypothetical protein